MANKKEMSKKEKENLEIFKKAVAIRPITEYTAQNKFAVIDGKKINVYQKLHDAKSRWKNRKTKYSKKFVEELKGIGINLADGVSEKKEISVRQQRILDALREFVKAGNDPATITERTSFVNSNGEEIFLGKALFNLRSNFKKFVYPAKYIRELKKLGFDVRAKNYKPCTIKIIGGKKTFKKVLTEKENRWLLDRNGQILYPRTEKNFFDWLNDVFKVKAYGDICSTTEVEVDNKTVHIGRILMKYKRAAAKNKISAELDEMFKERGIDIREFASGSIKNPTKEVKCIAKRLKEIFEDSLVKLEYRRNLGGLSLDIICTFAAPFSGFDRLALEVDGASHWSPEKIAQYIAEDSKMYKDEESVRAYILHKRKLEKAKDEVVTDFGIPLIRVRSISEFEMEIANFQQNPGMYVDKHNLNWNNYYIPVEDLVEATMECLEDEVKKVNRRKSWSEKYGIPAR